MTNGTPAARPVRLDRIAVALYAAVAIAIAFVDFYIRRNPSYTIATYVPQVLAGTYEAPFIYRPLAPWIIQAFTSLSGLSPMAAFGVLRLAAIFAALVAFHGYLRTWYSAAATLGATMAMAALLPLTLTNSWPVPGTYLELALFSAGAWAVARDRDWLFGAILLLASLNRETSIFLLALWVLMRAPGRPAAKWLPRGIIFATVWLLAFASLRWLYGFKTYTVFVLGQNLAYLNAFDASIDPRLRVFAWFWLLMLGVPGWLACRGARLAGAPAFARRAFALGLAFTAISLIAASIVEPRVLLPAFPLFAPAALAWVTGGDAAASGHA